MSKAIEAFTFRDAQSGLVTYDVGDDVPDVIAAQVGEHLLDEKPHTASGIRAELEAAGFDDVDEALVAANASLQAQLAALTDENGALTAAVEELQAWKDKVLSGDLEDLDLDTLTAPDGTPAAPDATAEPTEPLFDPSEHTPTQVLKHLEVADEAEDARVRAAEKAGKNRKQIVGSDD